MKNSDFASLFKKFRLRAGFGSLSQFGKALSEKKFVFEDSLFSRWQKGNRVPRERKVLLAILKVLTENQGITSLEEANSLLESAGNGYLTESEIEFLPKNLHQPSPFQVPHKIENFVGRKKYIEEAKKLLQEEGNILISGPSGVGKTALAIEIGHRMRHNFKDGVLWFRVDTSDPMTILSAIGYTFGENLEGMRDLETKASVVRSLLSSKNLLLILDNVEPKNKIHLLLPNSPSCSVLITSKYKTVDLPIPYSFFHLNIFNQEETLELFEKTLGKRYFERNKTRLLKIASLLGNLPLAINVLAKELVNSSTNIRLIHKRLKSESIKLETLKYEGKSLLASLNISFMDLDSMTKEIFTSLGVFEGKDFSKEAIGMINKISERELNEILEKLVEKSLLERSIENRYRLHPLVKTFLQDKIDHNIFNKVARSYLNLLEKQGRENKKSYPYIKIEIENIVGTMNKCLEWNFINQAMKIWDYIGTYLWDTGNWNFAKDLGESIYKILKAKDSSKALLCIRELSWIYYWQGDLPKAELIAKEGLELSHHLKDDFLIAYANQRLGKIFQSKHLFKKSLKLLYDSLGSFTQLNEYERVGDTLTYIAETYWLQGQGEKAKIYFNKAYETVKKIKDRPQEAIVCSYIGGVMLQESKYKKSEEMFLKSSQIARKALRRTGGDVWNNLGLGLAYYKMADYKNAKKFFDKALIEMSFLGMKAEVKKTSVFFSVFKKDLRKALGNYALLSHSL